MIISNTNNNITGITTVRKCLINLVDSEDEVDESVTLPEGIES